MEGPGACSSLAVLKVRRRFSFSLAFFFSFLESAVGLSFCEVLLETLPNSSRAPAPLEGKRSACEGKESCLLGVEVEVVRERENKLCIEQALVGYENSGRMKGGQR
jgi:hypothetical protein